MKRIVILCDGTWNSPDMDHPTNVLELTRTIVPQTRIPKTRDVDGQVVPITDAAGNPTYRDVAQVPIYIEGVGTGRRGVTRTGRLSDRIMGGAFGWGLMDNVAEAYRNLVFLWEPGDEVYIFGYSRGAFTARSLAGFIRYTGLLSRADLNLLPDAVARYAARSFGPSERRQERNLWWRAKHSPETLVDPADIDRLTEMAGDWEAEEALRRIERAVPFTIDYMGVWDTVGAMGIPGHLTAAPFFNRRHQFHDTQLSDLVLSARHAVAVDERRRTFPPTLWTNIDQLNGNDPARPYRQEWFPGNHGSVGGGGPVGDLSSAALDWVMEGAEAAGLQFRDDLRDEIRARINPMGPLDNRPRKTGMMGVVKDLMAADRDGPEDVRDVHATARTRWQFEHKAGSAAPSPGPWPYRPHALRRVRALLDRTSE